MNAYDTAVIADMPRLYIVGPHFKDNEPVRIKGVRGVGKIVGSKFLALVIEYTEYHVVIGKNFHAVKPDQLIADTKS